jgi:hypothetical protein
MRSRAGDCAPPVSVTTLGSTKAEAICLMSSDAGRAMTVGSKSPVYTDC